ncbi:MAG: tetratricopeptide repeat protein [Thermodesulfobacteriota bacterium]
MLVILLMIVVITYSHALHSPFVFDDLPNISRNPHIQLSELNLDELKDALTKSPVASRPVSNLTFAINWLTHQTNVSGYRLINFLIHIANGVLLYSFLLITLQLPVNQQKIKAPAELAFWATIIWFVHPIHVQSVTYVVQRMNCLATMFFMISLLCYLKARLTETPNTRLYMAILGIISFFMAMGSKEIAITLPIVVLFYEWFFFQDLDIRWFRKHLETLLTVTFLIGMIAFIYVGSSPIDYILAGYANREFSLWQRILTEPRVVLHYIDLFLLPHPSRLSLLHEFELSTSLTEPIITIPIFILLNAMVATAIFIARKHRLYSFCLLWFFGNIFLESSFIGLEIIFEHRTYLPSMMLGVFLLSIQRLFAPQMLHRAILVSLFLIFSTWTYERNSVWADNVALWQDTLQKCPQDVRVYNNLGQALEEKGQLSQAMNHYQEALLLDPQNTKALNHLGIVLSKSGKIESAIEKFKLALSLDREDPLTHYNLALAFSDLGYLDDAVHHYNMAHHHTAGDTDSHVHNNLGILLAKLGRQDEAIAEFKETIRINPYHSESLNNLGVIYAQKKSYAKAAYYFQAALERNSNDPVLHNRLGLAHMLQGQYDKAFNHFNMAIKLNPDYALAKLNLQRLSQFMISNKSQ